MQDLLCPIPSKQSSAPSLQTHFPPFPSGGLQVSAQTQRRVHAQQRSWCGQLHAMLVAQSLLRGAFVSGCEWKAALHLLAALLKCHFSAAFLLPGSARAG